MCIQTLSDKYDVELGYYVDSAGFQRKLSDEDVKPIPLTEDWLVKFGFKYLGEGYSTNIFYKQGCLVNWSYRVKESMHDGEWVLEQGFMDQWSVVLSTLEYVHQLQNLYFALTGEELNI